MSHANGWCRQCNNSLCWAGTYSLGCAETSHKLEGNVGRERAAWLETFQRRAGGWSATPGNCDGKIIWVLSTGRSCSDLHSADEKMSIEGDVKGENPREHNCQTWTELWVLSQKWLLHLRLTFSAGFVGAPSPGWGKEPWPSVAHVNNFRSTGLAVVR